MYQCGSIYLPFPGDYLPSQRIFLDTGGILHSLITWRIFYFLIYLFWRGIGYFYWWYRTRQGSLRPSPSSAPWGWKPCGGWEILSVAEDRGGPRTPQQLRNSLFLSCSCWGLGTLLLGGHVDHEVHHPVAVAEFIVVPGNELDKVVVEGNASPSIEGRRVSVAAEVAGDNLVLSVA